MSNAAFGKGDGHVNPDLPLSPDGVAYHLSCTSKDLADRIILVGDPGRVKYVAGFLDAGSIRFESSHREINIATGAYKGTPVSVVSTGMGTDNVEIVVNEIHVLKEYNFKMQAWRQRHGETPDAAKKAPIPIAPPSEENEVPFRPESIKIIRVGTSGSPLHDIDLCSLVITRYGIGMDNTGKYYNAPAISRGADVEAILKTLKAKTTLGKKVDIYATKASPNITNGLVAACKEFNDRHGDAPQKYVVGTTCSGSGFYGCQGRAVGRFTGQLVVPDMMKDFGSVSFHVSEGEERVANLEMENSSLCYLSQILGYEAGTICVAVARRSAGVAAFADPEDTKVALGNAITVALDCLATIH